MERLIRHDTVILHADTVEQVFEDFMRKDLLPYFGRTYRGPTRISVADLKRQSLLRDAKVPRRYLWTTEWEGSADAVVGASFARVRMSKMPETDAMLKRLDGYGRRGAARVLRELASVEVATNG